MGKHMKLKWRVRGISFFGIPIGWGVIEPGNDDPSNAHRFDTWEEAFAYAFERASNRVVLDRAGRGR